MTAQWKCIDLFSSGNINMTHWQLSPALCNSWLTLRQKYLTSALLFSLYFSLSLSLFLRQTFFYSACSWPLVQSLLPHPHLLFLSSACSSPVPLSSLCTAVECIWVLVGSPARTASQIPGLAALHPGCRTHATRHHRQKGGGHEVHYFREPPGCAIFLSYGVAKDYHSTCVCSWKINMETVKSVFTHSIVHVWWSLLVYSVWWRKKKVTEATNVEMF